MSTHASQSVIRGELELSDEVQRLSGSWLRKALRDAGYVSIASFAKDIGVPKSTAHQWERGCAANPPTHRPPARLMPVIANAVKVSVTDLLEKLWGEKDGDPCPCQCGGKKSFEDTPPPARTLAIIIPCAECGVKRIHKRWKKGRHRTLCPKCASTAER